MPIIDDVRDKIANAFPQKRQSLPEPGSTGLGHGVYRGEDVSSQDTTLPNDHGLFDGPLLILSPFLQLILRRSFIVRVARPYHIMDAQELMCIRLPAVFKSSWHL